MDFKNKKTLVLGLGRSGRDMIRYLHERGARLSAMGAVSENHLAFVEQKLAGIPVALQTNARLKSDAFLGFERIVFAAPSGKPFEKAWKRAHAEGIPWVGDLDLIAPRLKSPLVAITGTNGKSTTQAMIAHGLDLAGKRAWCLGGERQTLAGSQLQSQPADLTLLNLKSARLQFSRSFRPHLAILLNLAPGRSELHTGFREYAQAKARIFANQSPQDAAIYQVQDEVLKVVHNLPCPAVKYPFQYGDTVKTGSYFDLKSQTAKYIDLSAAVSEFSLAQFPHPRGPHLVEDLLASINALKILKVDEEIIQKMIDTFPGLPYRLQGVQDLSGIEIFNDAKAQNMLASIRALQSFPDHSVIWIAGGEFKLNQHYRLMEATIRAKVNTLIISGDFRQRFFEKWKDLSETFLVKTLSDAVSLGVKKATPGDKLLYSPAAPPERHGPWTTSKLGKKFEELVAEQKELKKFATLKHTGR